MILGLLTMLPERELMASNENLPILHILGRGSLQQL